MQISVKKFSTKGYGVGCLPDGKEVEIPHTVPGDEVFIDWKKKRHPPQKGRVLDILTPSPERIPARCAHATVCGGCCWQQMSYEAQLQEKETRVRKAFQQPVDPIIPCKHPFGYRNKMEFSFSQNRGGARYLGLMIAAAEPYVFNLTECHLGASWYSALIQAVRTWWESSGLDAYHPPLDTGTLRYLTLRHAMHTQQKMVILNISGRPEFAPTRSQLDSFVAAVQSVLGPEVSLFLRIHQTKKGIPTQFYEMLLHGPDHIMEELHLQTGKLLVKISPASFFQPNTFQAEVLYDTALAAIAPGSLVYDLYSGTGTLGLAAASIAARVIGIELSPEAVLDAEENAKRNHRTNVQFLQGDVGALLATLNHTPDTVIVDPPRCGLDPPALHHLKTLLPRQVLYISCNPLTQAANIRELQAVGYRLTRLQPVDQFPHTHHIENIAFLVR